jgi:hypothetical protein
MQFPFSAIKRSIPIAIAGTIRSPNHGWISSLATWTYANFSWPETKLQQRLDPQGVVVVHTQLFLLNISFRVFYSTTRPCLPMPMLTPKSGTS